MKSKNVIDWHFKKINPSDYNLNIKSNIDNKMMLYIFKQSRIRLIRKKGIKFKGNLNDIDSFEVPRKYFNLLKTVIYPIIKNARESIKEDGFILLNSYPEKAIYQRENNDWVVCIDITGQFADKR